MPSRLCVTATLSLILFVVAPAGSVGAQRNLVTVDVSAPIAPPETGYLRLGATSANGHSLEVNSKYLVLDGKPWLPVMGEFHFSRYSEALWEDEILKMQAGGVNIISTYIFWIHHEEVEGQFDWTGQRNVRRFIELCAKHGMYVWLRVGPWAHGEVRNGGFPDWVARLPNPRSNDPAYLQHVETLYNQIGLQVHGLMFKDGGPVIGTQLENEYGLHGPGRGADHILKLKQLALAAGIDTPIYSVTGWPSLDFPPQEVIPVYGGYPDGFWFAPNSNQAPAMNYLFNFNRELGDMGATVPTEDPTGKVDLNHFPFFAAEKAGGMASSYHRRPVMSADDIAALTCTGIGSGTNLYGYYMFHGGTNPKGKLSTLQESSDTGYPNDLPQLTYDFQAPLSEYGEERDSFRKTRLMHLFLGAFGSSLAPMPAFAPAERVRDAADTSTPRVAVRSDGHSGYVFVNNYIRQLQMPARPEFQVHIKLAGGETAIPAKPVTIPADTYFVWPFNLALGHAKLKYSTAQILTQLDTPTGKLIVFFAIPGIAPEFSFDPNTIHSLGQGGKALPSNGNVHVIAGMNSTIQLTDMSGGKITILVLTKEEAEQVTLFHMGSSDHLVLTTSDVFLDGTQLHLLSTASAIHVAITPSAKIQNHPEVRDGMWSGYTFAQPEKHPTLVVTQTQPATAPSPSRMGPYIDWRKTAVPVVPPDAAFATAATWQLQWKNPDLSGLSTMLLRIDYTGDIARLRSPAALMDDNFYNGLPWQVGLPNRKAHGSSYALTLQILPLPPGSPVYLSPSAHAKLTGSKTQSGLISATLIPQYENVATVIP